MPEAGRLRWVRKPMSGWVQEPERPKLDLGGIGWRKGRKGRMSRYKHSFLKPDEKTTILTLSAKGCGPSEIARVVGRNESTVVRFMARMADTSVLAKATLKAGAARLAERVINHANVEESIEVLSRPGMDVLQPATKDLNGGFGIQVSVGVGSCGTVVRVEGGSSAQTITQGVEPRLLEGQTEGRIEDRAQKDERQHDVVSDGSDDARE